MFRIEYEYYDKRYHVRMKKIECGTIDRVKFHCKNIEALTEHKPIGTPRIVEYFEGKPDKNISYKEMLK